MRLQHCRIFLRRCGVNKYGRILHNIAADGDCISGSTVAKYSKQAVYISYATFNNE